MEAILIVLSVGIVLVLGVAQCEDTITPGRTALLSQNYPFHLSDFQAEKEELTQAVVELKKQLLTAQLENTEIQEKFNKLHDNTGCYSVDTENGISRADDELVQNVDMLKKQLEA